MLVLLFKKFRAAFNTRHGPGCIVCVGLGGPRYVNYGISGRTRRSIFNAAQVKQRN